MRKIFLLLFCLSMAIGANAQIRCGAKVGGTLSSFTSKYAGERMNDDKPGIGFNVGGVLEYSFSESFALQPELLYVMHNIKPKEETGIIQRMELHNIQLPINLKYKMGVDKLKFYVTAGPYLAYLASAKMRAKENGISLAVDLFKFDEIKLRHFDYGLGVGFGVEVSKFTVGVGYQYGLANLTGIDNASEKLGTFNLSVGYFF
jgi:hypothetical protein